MSAAAKAEIRAAALAKRDALSAEDRAAFSAKICQRILDLAASLPAGPVSIFWPIRSEIDTRPLMSGLAALGFPVALPRVEGSSLEFRLWQSGAALSVGKFGLSEPLTSAPLTRPATMLIPLAAFDTDLHRIGYGKGLTAPSPRSTPSAKSASPSPANRCGTCRLKATTSGWT